MKKLRIFAASKGLQIVTINYRHCGHGHTYKGFDLIDTDKNIHVSLEPCRYTNYKWICAVNGEHHTFGHYRNISAVVRHLYSLTAQFKGNTGFKLSA